MSVPAVYGSWEGFCYFALLCSQFRVSARGLWLCCLGAGGEAGV